MPTKTLTPFEELKTQLSAEKSKRKDKRDGKLLDSLHSQINEHKKLLKIGFKKRSREAHKAEVQDRLKVEKIKIARYKKMHDKIVKTKLKEREKQEEKLQVKTVTKK